MASQLEISLIVSIIILIVVVLVRIFTGRQNEGAWYKCAKAPGNPSNTISSLLFEVCYILIGATIAIMALNPYHYNHPHQKIVLILILASLVINVMWSFFYFTLKELYASFFLIMVLDLFVLAIIVLAPSNLIRLFVLPYFLWILYVTVLNGVSLKNKKKCDKYR